MGSLSDNGKGRLDSEGEHKNPQVTMYINDDSMLMLEWEEQRTWMSLTLEQAIFMHTKLGEAIKELSHNVQKQN